MELALALQERHFPSETISPEQFLSQAFASFTQAADSLEVCYRQLQSEVVRLREQLEQRNRELADSFAQNQQMREFLERILDTLPCGVLVLTDDYRCRKINAEAQRILGGATETERLPQLLAAFMCDLKAQSGNEVEQIFTLNQSGQSIEASVRRASLIAADGSRDSVLFLRDVTLERQIATQRDAMKRMQALAEMSAVLAHEIRNPLGVLELVTGIFESSTKDNAEARHWLNHMRGGLRLLSATVNNVLQFYSDPLANFRAVELSALIRESIDFLLPLVRQQEMNVRFNNHGGEVLAAANPDQLKQVFFNLGLNAVRAMQPGGTLEIALFLSGDAKGRAVIQLRDEGCGIPKQNLDKIFSAGFTTRAGSPGLGLPVCRRIIQAHGGDIRVNSIEEEGSTFSIVLPLSGTNTGANA